MGLNKKGTCMNKKYIYFSILLLIFSFIFYQYKKVDFSVIIPVYNSEKYILKCLDSIISQDENLI